ncbi:MAG: hypothetical protein ACD_63C00051G0001 [uncultured bacterium]|nr:MAG: hypothetical protein ACD_63C00051G0001 [uncultured bacterium]
MMRLYYIAFLAVSNLKSRRLRTFLTVGGFTLGVGIIVFLLSFGYGLEKLLVERIIKFENLTVVEVASASSNLIKISEDSLEKLKNIKHVMYVSPSVRVPAQVKIEGSMIDVAVYGIQIDKFRIENIEPLSPEKRIGFTSSDAEEIIISSGLADTFSDKNFEKGDQKIGLHLLLQRQVSDEEKQKSMADTALQIDELKKQVIEESVKKTGEVDNDYISQKLDELEADLLGRDENEAEVIEKDVEVTVKGVAKGSDIEAFVPISFLKSLAEVKNYDSARLRVKTRQDVQPVKRTVEELGFLAFSLADTEEKINQIFTIVKVLIGLFGGLIIFIAALGVFNTMTISLLERTKEIGVMRAIGIESKHIYKVFLFESMFIGIIGGILGIVLGIVSARIVNLIMNLIAVKFGGEQTSLFYFPAVLVMAILLAVILISVLIGLYPARRAVKLDILDALKYE